MKWVDCLSGITICSKNDKSSRYSMVPLEVSFSLSLVSIIIIPEFIRNLIALRNSTSEISSDAHQPAAFLIHCGIFLDVSTFGNESIWIMELFTKNSII